MTNAPPAKPQHRAPAWRRTLAALAAGAALTLTSCTTSPSPSPDALTDSGTSSPTAAPADSATASGQPADATPAPADTAPALSAVPSSPEVDAPRIAAAVEAALRTVAGSQDSVSSDQVRGAIEQGFADAGSAPEEVEVSIDRTPTGLDVDAIQGAGRTDGTCIVGEVREGAVSVAVLPALASGRCFVGDQR
ncbi:DUF6993 domain-containing protein [Arthrobacter burdickii]|uniref:DUF6993 domain-containing protein n=1 Tax=Arthrobacter burdickii TaxID=3035920 RepID=A0ABT8K1Q2_9MICC|nr:hypothetical protein [Arthrobacter burdickii]MDN4611355.1 hypothetical protein [Arthrobacter burdickii]